MVKAESWGRKMAAPSKSSDSKDRNVLAAGSDDEHVVPRQERQRRLNKRVFVMY